MNHVAKKPAFTLIELMLAMTFVSALLIAVAMTVIQIANTYNRGLTIKEVNQAGNDLANELQRTIASVQAFDVSGVNSRYVATQSSGKIIGGRLCLGTIQLSFGILGNAIASSPKDPERNVYDASNTDEIRFVKAIDPDASYCDTDERSG